MPQGPAADKGRCAARTPGVVRARGSQSTLASVMTVLTSPADGDPPAASLIAAAQHLGQTVVADSLTPPAGSVAERLVLSAVVLGAAERQMLDIQNELAQGASQRQALSDAVRVTAEVACGDHPGRRWLWLGWRAAHLLTQLDNAPASVGQDTAKAAAEAVHAAALILQAQATALRDGLDSDGLPATTVADARRALVSALQVLEGFG
jgi:hypothetical protein